MPTVVLPEAAPSLAADPPAGPVMLWHRRDRKAPWVRVATVPSTRAAVALIRGRGDWWLSTRGRTPAEAAPPRY